MNTEGKEKGAIPRYIWEVRTSKEIIESKGDDYELQVSGLGQQIDGVAINCYQREKKTGGRGWSGGKRKMINLVLDPTDFERRQGINVLKAVKI